MKEESWIIILGNTDTGELIGLKRINKVVRGQMSVSLSFVTSSKMERQRLTLFVFSDGYLGLDQQFDFFIDIQPPSIESQINTEIEHLSDELDRRLENLK